MHTKKPRATNRKHNKKWSEVHPWAEPAEITPTSDSEEINNNNIQ